MGVRQTYLCDVLVVLNDGEWPPESLDKFSSLVSLAYPVVQLGPVIPLYGLKNIFAYAGTDVLRMRADMTFSPGVFIKMNSCTVQLGQVQGRLREFAEHMWNIPDVKRWRPGVNPTTLPPTCSIYSRAPPVARQQSSGSALSAIPLIAPAPSTTTCESSAASAPTTNCELTAAVGALRETVNVLLAELTALKGQVASLTVDRLIQPQPRPQGEEVEVQLQPQLLATARSAAPTPAPAAPAAEPQLQLQLQESQVPSQAQEPTGEAVKRKQPVRGTKRTGHCMSG